MNAILPAEILSPARRIADSLESHCDANRISGVLLRHQRRHAAGRAGRCRRPLQPARRNDGCAERGRAPRDAQGEPRRLWLRPRWTVVSRLDHAGDAISTHTTASRRSCARSQHSIACAHPHEHGHSTIAVAVHTINMPTNPPHSFVVGDSCHHPFCPAARCGEGASEPRVSTAGRGRSRHSSHSH